MKKVAIACIVITSVVIVAWLILFGIGIHGAIEMAKSCTENETFGQCDDACLPTCFNRADPSCKACRLTVMKSGTFGCHCNPGFVRYNEKCIKQSDCPRLF